MISVLRNVGLRSAHGLHLLPIFLHVIFNIHLNLCKHPFDSLLEQIIDIGESINHQYRCHSQAMFKIEVFNTCQMPFWPTTK